MKKKTAVWLIGISVILAFLVSAVFGRAFSSRLSMMPVIGKIVGPAAPVVITTTQIVTSPNPQDFSNIANTAKGQISLVLGTDGTQVTAVGGAINITSDGLFVAPALEFVSATEKYSVLLSDGRLAPITQSVSDARLGVVFFRAALQNVPVVSLDGSAALTPGEPLVVLLNATQNYLTKVFLTQVSQSQADVEHQIFSADKSSRSFMVQPGTFGLGSSIMNDQGNLVGLWNGSAIISSDALQAGIQTYLANPADFAEPQFGFSYMVITHADSQLLGLPEGAQVTAVAKPSKLTAATFPAFAAKMQAGDIITQINGNAVSDQNLPETVLEQAKPGDTVALTVVRGKDTITLQLAAGKE